MDRLAATIALVFALLQAQAMFVGAFQVSLRTDWQRLGHYFRHELLAPQETSTTDTATAEPSTKSQRKTIFVEGRNASDSIANPRKSQ